MKQWSEFDDNGDLPVGIHQGTLVEVLRHFGTGSLQRRLIGQRLERIYKLAYIEGASVFWIRRQAVIGGEQEALEHWQLKRDKTRRGIVEVISDDSERSRT